MVINFGAHSSARIRERINCAIVRRSGAGGNCVVIIIVIVAVNSLVSPCVTERIRSALGGRQEIELEYLYGVCVLNFPPESQL